MYSIEPGSRRQLYRFAQAGAVLASAAVALAYVIQVVPLQAALVLNTTNYMRFRGPSDADGFYPCHLNNGPVCAGSMRAPDTNWFVNYNTGSSASPGVLRAFADIYLTGDGSLGPLEGTGAFPHLATAGGRAGFVDRLTVNGGSGSGLLDFEFVVTGDRRSTPGQSGWALFQRLPAVNGRRQWDQAVAFGVNGDGIGIVKVPFTFGVPVEFAIEFYALAQIYNWVEGAAASANVTATLVRIGVTDANRQPVPGFAITADSGASYSAAGVSPRASAPANVFSVGSNPPASTPTNCTFSPCLVTWSALAEAATGRLLATKMGNPTSGLDSFGRKVASSIVAAQPVFRDAPPIDTCRMYEAPAPLQLILRVLNGPIACGGNGSVTQSAYARSEFGTMRAYAGLRADSMLPTGAAVAAFGGAMAAEKFFILTNTGTRTRPLAFPDLQVTGSNNNRVAVFQFDIHGSPGGVAQDATPRAGMFFRHHGGPCPMGPCQYAWQPWEGPSGARRVTVRIPFDRAQPLKAAFELVASAALAPTGSFRYTGYAEADFASTAVLTGIRVFEGTLDAMGSELTDLRILAESGGQYNARGAVVDVSIDVNPQVINASSRGKLKVTILPGPGFDPRRDVDPESLSFGAFGTERSLAFCDAAGDSDPDGGGLSCHFERQNTQFIDGDTEGVLQGRLRDGRYFQGTSTVRVH